MSGHEIHSSRLLILSQEAVATIMAGDIKKHPRPTRNLSECQSIAERACYLALHTLKDQVCAALDLCVIG